MASRLPHNTVFLRYTKNIIALIPVISKLIFFVADVSATVFTKYRGLLGLYPRYGKAVTGVPLSMIFIQRRPVWKHTGVFFGFAGVQ